MGDIIDMDDKLEFHRFALRVPESFYKFIEEMAWECRTSTNVMINDLLLFALANLDSKTLQTMKGEAFKDKNVELLFATLKKAMGEKGMKRALPTLDLVSDYLDWRNKP